MASGVKEEKEGSGLRDYMDRDPEVRKSGSSRGLREGLCG